MWGSVFQAVFAVVCPGFDGGTLEALMGKWLLATRTGQHEICLQRQRLVKKKKQKTNEGNSPKNLPREQQKHPL